jgi:hypothetical protein
MVIGGFVGLGVWRLLHGAPGMPDLPAPFMVVGMIACFGSVAHAPLGLMLMVAEMTGSLALLPPAIVALGIAALIVGDDSIYESQLRSRADAPAHRAAMGMPLLASVRVADVMRCPQLVIPADTPSVVARRWLDSDGLPGAPVVQPDGSFGGVLHTRAAVDTDASSAGDGADKVYPTVASDQGMDVALDVMVSAGVTWVPVLQEGDVVGIVGMNEVVDGYQAALRGSLRRVADMNGTTVLVEAVIADGSEFAGTTMGAAPWPVGAFALSIDRSSHLLVPRTDTALLPGDLITAIAPTKVEAELRRRLRGRAADP